jgi:hypothetical protein
MTSEWFQATKNIKKYFKQIRFDVFIEVNTYCGLQVYDIMFSGRWLPTSTSTLKMEVMFLQNTGTHLPENTES